jgi:hypothetical protein
MTGAEMISNFDIYYDYVSSGSAPGYLTEEKLIFLNNSQDDFIKERMFGKNFQQPIFEQNQKRVADLQTLVVQYKLLTIAPINPIFSEKSYGIPTSPDFLYYIDSISLLTRTNYPVISTDQWIKNKFINHNEIHKFINGVVNKTHFLNPVVWIEADVMNVMGDQFTTISSTNGQKLSYIKKPTAITNSTSSSDLPLHTHQEIVEKAVWQGLKVTGDPRWQTATAEKQFKTE